MLRATATRSLIRVRKHLLFVTVSTRFLLTLFGSVFGSIFRFLGWQILSVIVVMDG